MIIIVHIVAVIISERPRGRSFLAGCEITALCPLPNVCHFFFSVDRTREVIHGDIPMRHAGQREWSRGVTVAMGGFLVLSSVHACESLSDLHHVQGTWVGGGITERHRDDNSVTWGQ